MEMAFLCPNLPFESKAKERFNWASLQSRKTFLETKILPMRLLIFTFFQQYWLKNQFLLEKHKILVQNVVLIYLNDISGHQNAIYVLM